MTQASIVTFGPIGLAVALLMLLVARPGIIRSVEGKVLVVVALFVAPALAAYAGVSGHVDRAKSTSYCLSCHVMAEHGASLREGSPRLLAAAHYQNNLVPREQACYSCHTGYGLTGNHRAQARGVKHVLRTYFGSVPDTLKMARRYRNGECLRCHAGARSFEEAPAHHTGRFSLADIKAGKASCTRSGCHDLVHKDRVTELAMADSAAAAALLEPPTGPPTGLALGAPGLTAGADSVSRLPAVSGPPSVKALAPSDTVAPTAAKTVVKTTTKSGTTTSATKKSATKKRKRRS